MGHFPYPLVASHLLFASGNKHKISYPTQHTDSNNRILKAQNILGKHHTNTRIQESRSWLPYFVRVE